MLSNHCVCSSLYFFVSLRGWFKLVNHLNLALTLWALTNILWIMLPAGPWPAPITKTSGSSRRERTNLDKIKTQLLGGVRANVGAFIYFVFATKLFKSSLYTALSLRSLMCWLKRLSLKTYISRSSLFSALSQMENLAFSERACVMTVSMAISWLINS